MMGLHYQLAQVNIGRILAPMDSPIMSEFKNNLDRINELAEASEGFIWRLKDANNGDIAFAFGFKKRFTAEEAFARV